MSGVQFSRDDAPAALDWLLAAAAVEWMSEGKKERVRERENENGRIHTLPEKMKK